MDGLRASRPVKKTEGIKTYREMRKGKESGSPPRDNRGYKRRMLYLERVPGIHIIPTQAHNEEKIARNREIEDMKVVVSMEYMIEELEKVKQERDLKEKEGERLRKQVENVMEIVDSYRERLEGYLELAGKGLRSSNVFVLGIKENMSALIGHNIKMAEMVSRNKRIYGENLYWEVDQELEVSKSNREKLQEQLCIAFDVIRDNEQCLVKLADLKSERIAGIKPAVTLRSSIEIGMNDLGSPAEDHVIGKKRDYEGREYNSDSELREMKKRLEVCLGDLDQGMLR